jgi:hypothetical protein
MRLSATPSPSLGRTGIAAQAQPEIPVIVPGFTFIDRTFMGTSEDCPPSTQAGYCRMRGNGDLVWVVLHQILTIMVTVS